MLPTLIATLFLAQADLERVVHLTQTTGPALYAAVKAIAEPEAISANGRTITFRGTPEQGALADWLIGQLDGAGNAAEPEYRAGSEDLVHLFRIPNATRRQLSAVATRMRKATKCLRILTVPAAATVVMRGTPAQVALAAKCLRS